MGILLALGSNVCFALRNIGTKYYDDGESSQSKTTIEGFAAISLTGFIALIPVGFIFICYSYIQETQLEMIDTNPYLLLSAVSHVVYNLISLTAVLVMFDPLQHALLNVAKRVSIVLVFYLFVQQIVNPFNSLMAVTCLIVSIG